MNKDDILEKSRKENKGKDLYAQEIQINAGAASSLVSSLLATAFFLVEFLAKGAFNFGLYAIVFSFGATNFIVRAVHMKRRRDMALAVCYVVATVAFTVVFVCQMTAPAPA